MASGATPKHGPAPGRSKFRFLEPAALQGLRNLRLAARRIVEGSFAGRHRSRLRGSSVEFADYREYTPGDDLRRLDWKALARMGRPYLRTFDEETNLRCVFVLDRSSSMQFRGDPSKTRWTKLEYARYFLAATAYLVTQSRDQVGLAVGSGGLDQYLEAQSGFAHLDLVLHALEAITPAPKTDLGKILTDLYPRLRRRAVLVLFSDFLSPSSDDLFQALRVYRHRQFEAILFHVIDPLERDLPEGGSFRFRDPEGPEAVDAAPADVRVAYRERFAKFLEDTRRQALASGCDYEQIGTDVPYPEALRRFLRLREAMG
jgi:uncharacterized protein (DUF58 family)